MHKSDAISQVQRFVGSLGEDRPRVTCFHPAGDVSTIPHVWFTAMLVIVLAYLLILQTTKTSLVPELEYGKVALAIRSQVQAIAHDYASVDVRRHHPTTKIWRMRNSRYTMRRVPLRSLPHSKRKDNRYKTRCRPSKMATCNVSPMMKVGHQCRNLKGDELASYYLPRYLYTVLAASHKPRANGQHFT